MIVIKQKPTILFPAELTVGFLSDFYSQLDNLLQDSPGEIELDCSALDRVTSIHVSTLWQVHIMCQQASIPLRLSSVKYGLERVLRVLDLYHLLVDEGKGEVEIDGTETKYAASLQLRFKVTVEDINRALDKFRDFLMRLNLGEICAFDLETVFYEVATNIRLHGGLNKDDSVLFTASLANDRISLLFVDPGILFDPTRKASTCDQQQRNYRNLSRGLGLRMIKRMMDDISYERVNNRLNVLTLEKKFI